MKQTLKFKAEFHKAKSKIAFQQSKVAVRRIALLAKLKPFLKHPDDKKIIEMALTGKNVTPRYW